MNGYMDGQIRRDTIERLARKMCEADGFNADAKCFSTPPFNGPRGSYIVTEEMWDDNGRAWLQYSNLAAVAFEHFWAAFGLALQRAPVEVKDQDAA